VDEGVALFIRHIMYNARVTCNIAAGLAFSARPRRHFRSHQTSASFFPPSWQPTKMHRRLGSDLATGELTFHSCHSCLFCAIVNGRSKARVGIGLYS
jgi:hypothetical protein